MKELSETWLTPEQHMILFHGFKFLECKQESECKFSMVKYFSVISYSQTITYFGLSEI